MASSSKIVLPDPNLLHSVNRRSVLKHTTAGMVTLTFFGTAGLSHPSLAQTGLIKTVRDGFLTAGCSGDVMPLTAIHDGVPVGAVFEMLQLISAKIGLKFSAQLLTFPAVVEAVRSGSLDYFGDNFSWTPARSKILMLTDALFYSGASIIMRQSEPFTDIITVADFKGRTMGSGVGYSLVPDLKKVPGVKEVKLYDGNDPCVRDVVSGRLDFAVLDPPVIDYLIQKNPDWKIKQVPLKSDPTYPILTNKAHAIAGIDPAEPDLFDAMNQGIRWLWRTKQNEALMAKYGLGKAYFEPPEANPRIGVDRDEQGNVIGTFAHTPRDFTSNFS